MDEQREKDRLISLMIDTLNQAAENGVLKSDEPIEDQLEELERIFAHVMDEFENAGMYDTVGDPEEFVADAQIALDNWLKDFTLNNLK